MVCNTAFLTPRGLRYFQIQDLNIKQMANAIAELSAQRDPQSDYIFIVNVNTDGVEQRIECKDVLVDFRAFLGGNSTWLS